MRFRSLVSALVVLLLLVVGGSALAQNFPPYLALGDSIAFGFTTQAGFEYVNPTNFIPYGDYLSSNFHLTEVNAGCPGETSSSFLSAATPDHGCAYFKSTFPLHTKYVSTQYAFAASYLKLHPNTKLITLQIGANDGFMLEDYCDTQPDPLTCIATNLPGVLANVGANVNTILTGLRGAGFQGTIIVVNYYSLDYTDANATYLSIALNQVLSQVAAAHGAYVADVFSAFQTAAQNPFAQGKTCYAGLLNVDPLDQTKCDVHPTQSGHRLMAKTIGNTYKLALASQP
jgi:lysophospholipase L1-like esterase